VTARLQRRTGFEIELMAPPGLSRHALALDLAGRCGGRVRPVWHHDSEPSLVPGLGRFLHLTQGFEVRRGDGGLLCTLVDDITLVASLDPRAAAPPGWFRILTDDPRLLSLLAAHSDPGGTLRAALDATARLWGSAVRQHGDVYRLDDPAGATIALAAPQGGERERPCEIVTPPLAGDHRTALEELLGPARELGFTVPHEAAVHLHLDGAPFRRPHALACRRLAPLQDPLVEAVVGVPSYDDLRKAAADGGLTKFFDVNLTQLLTDTPARDTIEIRILPGAIDTDDIINRAGLVELLLDRCLDPEPFPAAPTDPDAAVSDLLQVAAGVLASRQEVEASL
jgi:hypothetical protein